MSSSNASLPSPHFVDEPAWWRTVAWPQVVTLLGIALAVLLPVLAALAFAA